MKKILLIIITGILFSGCTWNFGGNGSYIGYIPDVWQQGYIWKNYRFSVKPTLESSETYQACLNLNNDELIKIAKQASRERRLVEINYNLVAGLLTLSECSGNVVTDIKFID